ncbi:VOC family protein [Cryptosporangium sp. NPDC048952]|uniref:VOC family protein n=1 Tax=Cryptosporangium sp. NPDC048952 TaxID=3363961 RepID=UPI00371106E8
MSGPSTIESVASVVVPITDHDRSIAFYVGTLGFRLRADFSPGPAFRWVEVAPTDAATTIALAVPRGGMWGTAGGETNINLACTDVVGEHVRLRNLGVDVDAEILRVGAEVPPMFRFRDPDRNVLQVVQTARSRTMTH